MKPFNNILLVADGLRDDEFAIQQALLCTQMMDAKLTLLILTPRLAGSFSAQQARLEESLAKEARLRLRFVAQELGMDTEKLGVPVVTQSLDRPAHRIIREVLKSQHDLVIKAIASPATTRGFRAIDMELLRKCPCPVWLSRPSTKRPDQRLIGVAIDPEAEGSPARDLSIRMLRVAGELASRFGNKLIVISCWDYALENYFQRNPWFKITEADLAAAVAQTQSAHGAKLNELIKEAGLAKAHELRHVRGAPDVEVAATAAACGVDLLLMGTLARVGISGMVIGNTAENILSDLTGSLLAFKPAGFVSPVSAY